jgi:CSLREA domain-containing protein
MFAPTRQQNSGSLSFLAPRLRPPRPLRRRPSLELLEDRTAPAVFVVNSLMDGPPAADGNLTLREAITAANTNAVSGDAGAGDTTPDTITFAAALQGGTINLTAGELSITGGGNLGIFGPGGVPSGITVSGQNAIRVFNITGPDVNLLMNLTVTQGNTAGSAGNDGGGIVNTLANTTLTNVVVTNNVADDAGGGLSNTGTLTLNNTVVSNNRATNDAGGIYNDGGALNINSGSRISGNSTINDDGGGLQVDGAGSDVTIEDSTIDGNTADGGGEGGGIRQNDGTVTIRRSTISGNVADTDGGGIDFVNGTLNVVNSTLASNVAGQDGGGVQVANGTATITNTTIVRNAAISNGGGVFRVSGTANLNNSIVALNQAGTDDDIGGTVTNNNTFVGTTDGNPFLGPLQDNGGPTFTVAPQPGSPVIDNGNNALAVDPVTATPLTTDQRGMGFSRILGGTVDQGAVEVFDPTTMVMLSFTQRDENGAEQPLTSGNTSTARYVTLQATVMGTTGAPVPMGAVNFFDDPDGDPSTAPVLLNITPIQVNSTGMASLPNVAFAAGPHNLFARFTPSSQGFAASASPAQALQANIIDTIGVYDPAGRAFFLTNQNTSNTTGADFSYSFGFAGSQGVVGNWTGGAADISFPAGVVAQGTALRWDLADDNPPVLPNLTNFNFGMPGQIPVVGDWDGDGVDGVGVVFVNPATSFLRWELRNTLSAGPAEIAFDFGGMGFLPVVGNWDGVPGDEVGVYLPTTMQWYLSQGPLMNGVTPPLRAGSPFTFGGQPNAQPLAGDWNGNGTDGIGVFFPGADGFSRYLLRSTPDGGAPDVNGGNEIIFGLNPWLPLAGNWGPAPLVNNELQPLQAAEGQGPGAEALDPAVLELTVSSALERVEEAGASPEVLTALLSAQYNVVDLPDGWLGATDVLGQEVFIDRDGAGHGWLVDATSEEAEGHDLLTAVLHEMGHLRGNSDGSGSELMHAFLEEGVQHTDALDEVFAQDLL